MTASIKGRLSSNSNEWATPDSVYNPLDLEFGFSLDCAASPWNAKTAEFCTKEDDGLTADWYQKTVNGRVWNDRHRREQGYRGPTDHRLPAAWLNPPYGRAKDENGKATGPPLLDPFIRKAHEESKGGIVVVVLCFVRPDTALWEETIMRAAEVRFIRSRVKFTQKDGTTGPAPAPSCIVIFSPHEDGPPDFSVWHRQDCTCQTCKEEQTA